MSRLLRQTLSAGIVLVASATALAGEITFFEYPDFGGRRVTLRASTSNFDPAGFNDRASSMVIRDGVWELCTDAYFRGRCASFGPGDYRTLGASFADSISSAREVGGPPPQPPSGQYYGSGAPRIELWERREFGGRSIVLESGAPDFERLSFNDRADAAVVYGGVWRLCEHAGLGGQCREFGPGRYNDLGYLGGKVSSAAIVGGMGDPIDSRPPGGGGYVSPGRPRAVLYETDGFGGRTFVVESDVMNNLDRTGFNDRASSIRIEGGYWMFCTDMNFQGTCRTFGPGEYATLPWEIDRKISSGRRISEHYPYSAPPQWGSPR